MIGSGDVLPEAPVLGVVGTMGAIDRRLAAIMVADMEQYSRLMHEDERGTVLAWQKTREEVVKPTIASHSGNIIKNTGDGLWRSLRP